MIYSPFILVNNQIAVFQKTTQTQGWIFDEFEYVLKAKLSRKRKFSIYLAFGGHIYQRIYAKFLFNVCNIINTQIITRYLLKLRSVCGVFDEIQKTNNWWRSCARIRFKGPKTFCTYFLIMSPLLIINKWLIQVFKI
jgi:hypothetical protein